MKDFLQRCYQIRTALPYVSNVEYIIICCSAVRTSLFADHNTRHVMQGKHSRDSRQNLYLFRHFISCLLFSALQLGNVFPMYILIFIQGTNRSKNTCFSRVICLRGWRNSGAKKCEPGLCLSLINPFDGGESTGQTSSKTLARATVSRILLFKSRPFRFH